MFCGGRRGFLMMDEFVYGVLSRANGIWFISNAKVKGICMICTILGEGEY